MSQKSVIPRKRKAPLPKIVKLASSESTNSTPNTIIQRHVVYASVDGRVTTRTSFQATVDPSSILPESTLPAGDPSMSNDTDLDDSLDFMRDVEDGPDSEYLKDLLDSGKPIPRRARGAGVSNISNLFKSTTNITSAFQDHPLQEWIPEVDSWLCEMIRLEGRGEFQDSLCPHCASEAGIIRCTTCCDLALYCQVCIVALHAREPTHRIMVSLSSALRYNLRSDYFLSNGWVRTFRRSR